MARTISYNHFGGPDVLELHDGPEPQPKSHQVRIRVKAASVNPTDAKIRRGELEAVFPASFPVTPGFDAAGVIDAVGDDMPAWSPGDEVFGIAAGGSYADYALLDTPSRKPAPVSWELAASLPTAGEAAVRALGHLAVTPGETLLIHGAAGAVGSIATQLAVSQGVTVIGSVSQADQERAQSLGARAVHYGPGLVDRVRQIAPPGVDAVLDTVGLGVLPDSIELARGPERVVTLADPTAHQYGVRFTGADPTDRAPHAASQLADAAATGDLNVTIWRTYPLTDAARAHTALEARLNQGKIILRP
jgi:NADPH:quinone reductase-like Zn-dependent oxidoreductase